MPRPFRTTIDHRPTVGQLSSHCSSHHIPFWTCHGFVPLRVLINFRYLVTRGAFPSISLLRIMKIFVSKDRRRVESRSIAPPFSFRVLTRRWTKVFVPNHSNLRTVALAINEAGAIQYPVDSAQQVMDKKSTWIRTHG